MRRGRAIALACSLLWVGLTPPAHAQTAGGAELSPLPSPPAESGGGIGDGPARTIAGFRFRFRGDPLLRAALVAAARPAVGQPLRMERLNRVRAKLTRVLIERGYVNSGVTIPDQTVAAGVVTLRVHAGRLATVEVETTGRLRPVYAKHRLALDDGPLKIDTLAARIQLLERDPRVRRLEATLAPADEPGRAALRVKVVEAPATTVRLGVDNARPPSVGGIGGRVTLEHNNVSGYGDSLAIDGVTADGLVNGGVRYRFPVSRAVRLEARYRRSDVLLVEPPFERIDVESRVDTFGVALERLWTRTLRTTIGGRFAFTHKQSRTTLDGVPFSFSPGASDGELRIATLDASVFARRQFEDRLLRVRLGMTHGLDVADATRNANGPDGVFRSWTASARYVQRLRQADITLSGRVFAQLSEASLLALARVSVGGVDSVRGYRENRLVRDNALIVSFEARRPVFRAGEWLDVALLGFVDGGRGWNHDTAANDGGTTLSSMGMGLELGTSFGLEGSLEWGHGFDDSAQTDATDALQDDGIHFNLSYARHF